MPYGIPEDKGGDSLKNVAKMESCVASVKKDHPEWDESRVIATCKKALGYTKDGK